MKALGSTAVIGLRDVLTGEARHAHPTIRNAVMAVNPHQAGRRTPRAARSSGTVINPEPASAAELDGFLAYAAAW